MATVNEERKEKQLIISGEQLEKAISDIAELKKSLENTGDLSGVPELQEQVNTIEANLKKINDLAVTDSVEISSVKIRLGNLEENTYTKEETDSTITTKVSEIVAGAPKDFDTLKEMSDWLTEHSDSAATMNSDIANLKTGISEHTASIEALEENLPKVYEDVTAETNEKLVPLEANIGANAEAIEALETDISLLGDKISSLTLGLHTDGLFYIFVNNEPVGNGISLPKASGDVYGNVDSENNIVLNGDLADGNYYIKYEMADGSTIDIGELVLGAAESEPVYTNFADPTSADWKEGYRLSISSGNPSALAGHTTTNFIPCKMGDVLRVKGLDISKLVVSGDSDSSNDSKIVTYDSSKTKITGLYASTSGSSQMYGNNLSTNGDISTITLLCNDDGLQMATSDMAYIRIDGGMMSGYTKNDVIITINEEIV